MAKIKEKEIAQKLRRKGWSIGDIAEKLSVSKSTVSHWCRDIALSVHAIERISTKSKTKSTAALLKFSEKMRRARLEDTVQSSLKGKKMIGVLSKRDIFCIGLGLYWGEGYKRGSQEFGFTNSDPLMIKFYIQWLESVFAVAHKDLILRVSINASHAHRISEVQKYWSHETNIPESQFTKISLIKTQSKKRYTNEKAHFGTLRIKVRRGTQFRREVLGAIAAVTGQSQ